MYVLAIFPFVKLFSKVNCCKRIKMCLQVEKGWLLNWYDTIWGIWCPKTLWKNMKIACFEQFLPFPQVLCCKMKQLFFIGIGLTLSHLQTPARHVWNHCVKRRKFTLRAHLLLPRKAFSTLLNSSIII